MIEVGEYVRTKKGKIFRYGKGRAYLGKDNEIVKYSKNIIDLIEVGDYVNGKYVQEINQYKDGKSIIALIGIIDANEIKEILTKEQYNANCYKVEE